MNRPHTCVEGFRGGRWVNAKKYHRRYFGSHARSLNLDSPAERSLHVEGTSVILRPRAYAFAVISREYSNPPVLSIVVSSSTERR